MKTNIAFITYETQFAPCGGIAAVVSRLPIQLKNASKIDTIVITPFHHKIKKTNSLVTKLIGNFNVKYMEKDIIVDILKYSENNIDWFFLKPSDDQFFSGYPNPYIVGKTQTEISENLLRDSLFFGVAVAKSLPIIENNAEWLLLMQDWETASTTLALSSNPNTKSKLFLTLHNSYDSISITDELLQGFEINPDKCKGPENELKPTMLERVLPKVEKNIFTVSHQFALDFVEDVFQTQIMAPHLQNQLAPRLKGVDNGPFAKLAIPTDIFIDANKKNYNSLAEWKKAKRVEALNSLESLIPDKEKILWGNRSKFIKNDAPWFVFAGRDDTRQKGYDVAVLAVSQFLESGGDARFLFFPIPGDEDLPGLKFLEDFANKYPEHVLVLPFIWKEGYMAALQGATFGVMPSLYEPFGMANEFYLNGTLGIGRATGGLLQQIVPIKSVSSFSSAVQSRTTKLHLFSAHATGILYREKDRDEGDKKEIIEGWKGINNANYDPIGGINDRVNERAKYLLFREMANELKLSIIDGISIYKENQSLYFDMLMEGINHISCSFSWERTAQEYIREIL